MSEKSSWSPCLDGIKHSESKKTINKKENRNFRGLRIRLASREVLRADREKDEESQGVRLFAISKKK